MEIPVLKALNNPLKTNKMTKRTYHYDLYGSRCIVKTWFSLFGKRLFLLNERPATEKEKKGLCLH